MTSQYPVWACALLLIVGACTAAAPPSASPSATTRPPVAGSATPTPEPTVPVGLADRPVAVAGPGRRWHTVPDGLSKDAATIAVTFGSVDPTPGSPRARVGPNGPTVPLRYEGSAQFPTGAWLGVVPLDGVTPGERVLEVIVRLRDGTDAIVASRSITVSAPEYVVWTLDFEGDESSDPTMANTAAISEGQRVPMTVMWNPRAWTSAAVSPARADAMLAWTKGRAAKGDEVALHVHMWTDYVRAAGVAPRLQPRWAGRPDGYDVPITAYTEEEQRTLIAYGLRLMAEHGLAGVTSFRAGGDFGDAATLRALLASGITADCTAVAAGTFGSLRLPWTLRPDAQPYVPSREDANAPGDLAILEVPTNAGNTYGFDPASIAPVVRADLGMLARPGEVATARKGLTIVSHPGTIDATERSAIETLLGAFDPYRYDRDRGPLRFVTLRQLAQAWR